MGGSLLQFDWRRLRAVVNKSLRVSKNIIIHMKMIKMMRKSVKIMIVCTDCLWKKKGKTKEYEVWSSNLKKGDNQTFFQEKKSKREGRRNARLVLNV